MWLLKPAKKAVHAVSCSIATANIAGAAAPIAAAVAAAVAFTSMSAVSWLLFPWLHLLLPFLLLWWLHLLQPLLLLPWLQMLL
jgi:hypothetical protein